jgi:hypothetical protein
MYFPLDACSDEKDSGLFDNFENIHRAGKLSPTVLEAALSASATESLLLNSERIERQFGSYGIDVLASEAGLRRSSLFSIENDVHVCRTYAVVHFAEEPDTLYGAEHGRVLHGNSLGEEFKSQGWAILKQTLHIGSFELKPTASQVSRLMQVTNNRTLALHVYQLLLAKKNQVFEYATIIEAHHPDYLSHSDLLEIYQYDDSQAISAESITKLVDLISGSNDK